MRLILPILLGSLLFLVIVLFLGQFIFEKVYPPPSVKYGVTFSPQFAQSLGLDWQDTYIKILDELKVSKLRLPSYWDILEPQDANYDFSQIDFMLDEASKRGVQVILVVGVRQPRWPECHIPKWAKSLSVSQRQQKITSVIQKVVIRFKNHPAVVAYQIENEPLLKFFGECDNPNIPFLKSEVELVRQLSNKPIILSDSGELGFWITPMQLSDIFGTTIYRTVYNSILGYTDYPILPYLYQLKSYLIRAIFAPKNQKTIIVELQAEPWLPKNNLKDTPIDRQIKLLSVDKLKKYVDYGKKTGFDEAYFWGVEWWFWMKEHGHPEYLNFASHLW